MPNFLSTAARKIRAAGTLLTFGSIADGQALVRSGTSIIGFDVAPVTVSTSTATLGATDTIVVVTTSATTLTLAAATDVTAGKIVTIHCSGNTACLITLARAGSDTIDAATSRAGMVRPGGSITLHRISSSAWTSTLNIDPRPAMSYFEWRPDASSGNLSNVASGWTQAGTAGASVFGGRLYATEARAGSTAATGWTHGSKFFLADGRTAFVVDWYVSAVNNQHRTMIGEVDGFYSGTRGAWGGKGVVIQYEFGDTNWQIVVRDSANSVHNTGAAVAAGHWRLLVFRDGSVVRWVIYYSATDATFAGVAPVVGSATPSAWPTTGTTLQGQLYAAAGASWTGTLGTAGVAFGEML